jgi:hypothetical protein
MTTKESLRVTEGELVEKVGELENVKGRGHSSASVSGIEAPIE